MELIDKDSLMEIMNCNKPLADGYHMKDYVFNQIIHDIDNEPTIEAISIKWIEEYIKNNIDDEFISLKGLFHKMIIDWRKENEK